MSSLTENRWCDKLKNRNVSDRRTEKWAGLSAENPVMKRVRIQECHRESPVGERESRRICGRWLLRGVAERQDIRRTGYQSSGRQAATGPPVTAAEYWQSSLDPVLVKVCAVRYR